MKKVSLLNVILLLFIMSSCSNNDDGGGNDLNNLANRESSCNNVIGLTGAYWDFANGIPLPLNSPPVIQNPGGQFIHSRVPLLGFILPQGFSAFEVTEPQTAAVGVNVIRNDNAVVFRWIPNSFILANIPSQTILANEINTMFANFNFNGDFELLCTNTQQTVFEGIPIEFNARLIRFGNMIGQVWVKTTYVAGGTAMAISVVAAPENEYDSQVIETFLPFNFQLYVDDRGNIVDKDNDGFTVLEDPDDNDPNVPVNKN